jgi:hypothetical protein
MMKEQSNVFAFFGKVLLAWALAMVVGMFFLRYMEIPTTPPKVLLGSFIGVFISVTLGWIK